MSLSLISNEMVGIKDAW